ncbi:ATP-binding protein [Streptomyces sp. NPDC085944]|uniref:ATP-binding protein n=1 Tax=Streptomyces sp. NPDC085944 TaxID=3154962 RepID=UPI003434ACFB
MTSTDATGCERRWVLPFEALPAEVRLLRRAVDAQVAQWGVPVSCEEVQLVVTELATNVIKHVGEGASATLVLELKGRRLRVEMHDKSRSLPALRAADCDAECGRGLHLLAAIALDWGVVATAVGKAVWCEVGLDSEMRCRRVERAVMALENYQTDGGTASVGSPREAALEESAIELIADLLHWTSALGRDPDDVLDQAQRFFEAKREAA